MKHASVEATGLLKLIDMRAAQHTHYRDFHEIKWIECRITMNRTQISAQITSSRAAASGAAALLCSRVVARPTRADVECFDARCAKKRHWLV